MNVFAGFSGGSAEKKGGSVGAGVGGALLELTPHKMAMCHLVQVFAPPAQSGAAALPFPFESVAHHNRFGLFLFALTRGVCHLLANLVVYCSSTDTAYDLAEDEDFNSEMGMTNLMDADIGVRAGIFDKYSQGYAAESHIGVRLPDKILYISQLRTMMTHALPIY